MSSDKTTASPDIAHPLLRQWRSGNGYAVLRLKVDVVGASMKPVRYADDLVLTRWHSQGAGIATGWLLHGIGFICILNEPDVEVIERP